ncbi:hypothetical protein M2282_001220 [Variovorax boronicumulans]|nr:hypothetical protein [Variovorax boronicumulans]
MSHSDNWVNAVATPLAHLHDADEATVWAAIPAQWLLVTGEPCDQEDSYHVMLAGCVVQAVRHPR